MLGSAAVMSGGCAHSQVVDQAAAVASGISQRRARDHTWPLIKNAKSTAASVPAGINAQSTLGSEQGRGSLVTQFLEWYVAQASACA